MYKQLTKRSALIASLLFSTVVAAGGVQATEIEYQYAESAGGQGKDLIRLEPPRTSGGQCAVFDSASIVYKKRRYGQADIVSKPSNGCNPEKSTCKLEVKWEHAPAGRLNYQVRIDWKLVSGC